LREELEAQLSLCIAAFNLARLHYNQILTKLLCSTLSGGRHQSVLPTLIAQQFSNLDSDLANFSCFKPTDGSRRLRERQLMLCPLRIHILESFRSTSTVVPIIALRSHSTSAAALKRLRCQLSHSIHRSTSRGSPEPPRDALLRDGDRSSQLQRRVTNGNP
jgi:hypothetical protein